MAQLPVRYWSPTTGQPRLSVTQTLTVCGRIAAQWYTPESAERGQVVHGWTAAFDLGHRLPLIPDDLHGYADAYATFVAECRPVYTGVEVEAYRDDVCLAGRIDRVLADLWGAPGLLDIKTGGPAEWHADQLAAYNLLRPTGARWVLYLRPTGRYVLKRLDEVAAYRRFLFDLATARGRVMLDGQHTWVW